MSRRLFFTGGVPADVDNRFTPGSGVGGRSRAVRRALVRRAADSTCCQPGGGASGGHGAPGGGYEPGINIDVGFWIESSGMPLDKIQAIFGAQNGADGTAPGLNIKILVLRMNSYARPATSPTDVASLVNNSNEDFYGDVNTNDSFANWVASNPGILDSVEEIWVLPYQDVISGFDKNYSTGLEQYMNDLWVAANFINNKWRSLLPSEIANKVKGIVFEFQKSTIGDTNMSRVHLTSSLFGTGATEGVATDLMNVGLASGRKWSNAGISFGQGAAITGNQYIGNPEAVLPPGGGVTGKVYYWRGYSRYFPQIYNVGNLIVPGKQAETNQNFWNKTNEAWQKDSKYSRMFSLEAQVASLEKWGKGAFSAVPSLANVIQYIRQQEGLGTSVLFTPSNFDYSKPLIR